ncbi:hypothetical protein COTS27_01674 [Spirochaetota bacterium]|nr:hypothetical protein COTS27_01674 [Spirochaetota bacterium]
MSSFLDRQPPWYEEWFDENYIDLYINRDDRDAAMQLDLIEKTLPLNKGPNGDSLLDAACGYGRHVAALLARGYTKTRGIDLSKTLIAHAHKKNPMLPIKVGDIRTLEKYEKPQSITAVLSLFTSFGYFANDTDHLKALTSMHTVLKQKGWLWLDFLNPDHVKSTLKHENMKTTPTGKQFHEKRAIVKNRIVKTITVTLPNATPQYYQESVLLYTKKELIGLAEKVGFSPQHVFGDYTGAAITKTSPRMIFVFQK